MPFLQSVVLQRDEVPNFESYPYCLPVVRNLDRLPLHPSVTYFVGENGTGKSTLLEAIAVAAGFNPEGGTKNFTFSTRETHSPLHKAITLGRGARSERDGFFLRAESFYNFASELEFLSEGGVPPPTAREIELHQTLTKAYKRLKGLSKETLLVDEGFLEDVHKILNPPDLSWPDDYTSPYGGPLHEKSHGEAFLALATHRFGSGGLFILDEPEAALSPARQLAVLLRIHELVKERSQFIIATHSPLLMAYPDSKMYSLTADGISETTWQETEHYELTKSFLDRPDTFLRHLFAT